MDELLLNYMNTFYGFGDYKANYWFIGMEPGGGRTVPDIHRRLELWCQRNQLELEDDIAQYHFLLTGNQDYLKERQPTWDGLIRTILPPNATPEQIGNYRANELASNSGACLLELFPLPSRNTGEWLYNQISNLPHLHDRPSYRNELAPIRLRYLSQKISVHHPQAVIFYGLTFYKKYWRRLIRDLTDNKIEERTIQNKRLLITGNKKSVFAVMQHPESWGMPNMYFEQVGACIRNFNNKLEWKDNRC